MRTTTTSAGPSRSSIVRSGERLRPSNDRQTVPAPRDLAKTPVVAVGASGLEPLTSAMSTSRVGSVVFEVIGSPEAVVAVE